MTINYSSGNDIIIPTNNTTYRGLQGDDIYVISKAIPSDLSLSIIDTKGKNIIQLIDGLKISSSKFSSDALNIILSNGASITINGAFDFSYEIGGNVTSGISTDKKNFLEFSKLFGIQDIPKSGSVLGDTNLVIRETSLISNNIDFSWIEKTPESIGLDSIEVNELMDFVKIPEFNTQAAILIQGNYIIAEYYGEGYDKSSLVTSWSVAKSFTSTLIGIAIDEGYISSINDPITDYLPEWKGKDQDNILLKHLLAMQSGMDDHPLAGVVFSTNMVKYSLDRDVLRPPETAFSYSNEDSMLLGEILENSTGLSVQDYADKKLFNILEIEDKWWTDQAGNTVTYAGLDMNPRDFAKFGLMVAQDGKWENKEVVSSEWLETATNNYNDLAPYGFQWWTSNSPDEKDYNFFSAKGLDGQLIYVWPEIDLVFVRFTKYQHVGDKESSVVNFPTSYQNTESGNLPTVKLEELLYDIGDNLILNSDIIVTNDFG
ncbi:beta-lactamase family protein [Rhodobiaceae bacterium]|nr:beta-lactamase family protein [Rhodobiaceae bacterium]